MATQVPNGGHVLATDIDTTALVRITTPGVAIKQHDVVNDPMPDERFDLIHARFVLEHLRERDHVLDRLVHALSPGGILVIESIAEFPIDSSPHEPFRHVMRSIERVLAQAIGTDSRWPRGFPAPLQRRGLTEVGTQVIMPPTGGHNASAECWSLTLQQLRPQILDRQLCDETTINQVLVLLDDPDFYDYTFATIACWGTA